MEYNSLSTSAKKVIFDACSSNTMRTFVCFVAIMDALNSIIFCATLNIFWSGLLLNHFCSGLLLNYFFLLCIQIATLDGHVNTYGSRYTENH